MAVTVRYTTATWEAMAAPASATDAYTAWLTELGVADQAAGLTGDDQCHLFDGVPLLAGAGTVRTFWSTEGGLGLFLSDPTSESTGSIASRIRPSHRMFGTLDSPQLLLVTLDAASNNRQTIYSRKAISGETLLLSLQIRDLNADANAVHTALRVRPGTLEVVVTNVSATSPVVAIYGSYDGTYATGRTLASDFIGTVAYTLTPDVQVIPLQLARLDGVGEVPRYVVHDPSQSAPPVKLQSIDLRDRFPFGLHGLPSDGPVSNGYTYPWEFKGKGRIVGTVKEIGVPVNTPVFRRLRLYRERDGALVKTVWSDPVTGVYEFYGVRMDCRYTVVGHDYALNYRAVVADNLEPEPIT